MKEPWEPGATPEEQQARREALRRLGDAARRVGVPLEQLARMLRQVAVNEAETRRFLVRVYEVPDEGLDELVRDRVGRLEREP